MATDFPAARPAAAWTVASIHAAEAASATEPIASVPAPAAGTIPRRTSRSLRRSRPCASRRWTVRTGRPSWPAACSLLSPSRWHRTIGARNRSGSRSSSACRSERVSGAISDPASRAFISAPRCSIARLRAACARAFAATFERHAEEPARHRVGPADRAGPLRQHQERRLRGVLGVVEVGHRGAADAQDHRSVPLHQRRERRGGVVITPPGPVPLQQLAVGQRPDRTRVKHGAQVPRRNPSMLARHRHVALAPRLWIRLVLTCECRPRGDDRQLSRVSQRRPGKAGSGRGRSMTRGGTSKGCASFTSMRREGWFAAAGKWA